MHSTVTAAAPAALRRPTTVRTASIALLPGLFPPLPTSLEKRVRRALLLMLTLGATGGAIAWLVLSRDSDLAWPVAVAIAGSLVASAIRWHELPGDAFAIVGIAATAWVAEFVWLTGGPRSAQAALAVVPVLVLALGVSRRVGIPLALAASAVPALPLLYGVPTPHDTREAATLVAILAAIAVGGAFLMGEARAVVEIERVGTKRSEYYSVVAHELRNPLVAIGTMARVLARQSGTTVRADAIEAIAVEAKGALALLDGLNDIASIESGRLRLHRRAIDLCGVVREITSAPQTHDHPLEVTGIDESILVTVDDRRIGQVLRNLISNAAKYSPAGAPIGISVSVAKEHALVCVRDAGPGVPADERAQLFQKFARLSTAGGTRGSGLGLYISRMIVRDHDGDLWGEWPDDGGSLFCFTLPLRREA